MPLHFFMRSISRLQSLKHGAFGPLFAIAVLAFLGGWPVFAQDAPQEAYGPYNANFLPDGSGLIKPLAPPPSLDPRYQGPQPPDSLTAGDAPWTLAFWFDSSEPVQMISGATLLAGFGNPADSDARFIGVENNHLGLWLGEAQGTAHLLTAAAPLGRGDWHFAAAVSDGQHVTLYADGLPLATWPLMQGTIAAQIQLAPETAPHTSLTSQTMCAKQPLQPALATTHFGGRIAALKIYREALSSDEIRSIFDARPDFNLPFYEETSPHWSVQTRGQAGMSEPQNPSTLPRSKAPFQKPVAQPVTAADLQTEMVGENPWKLHGGWRLAPAPTVKAAGEEISKPGFNDKDWMVAVVPGTVLTTMVARGLYPNPEYGLNNMAIPETLAHQDYWYRVEFKAPTDARGRRLTLSFLGVNYAAEVWLNGKELGGFKGAFLRGTFDVTSLVKDFGVNALAVRVSPPPHAGIPQEESLTAGPGEDGGVEVLDGPTFAASEGWDWIPSIRDRNTGIWQDVTLTASGPVQIGDINVVTTLPKPDRSEADIEIDAPLTNLSEAPVEGELTASFDDVKVTKQVRLAPGENDIRLEPNDFPQLKVQHPRLWWPNGYGDPTLHTLHTNFTIDRTVSSTQQIEFGMREVSYEFSLLDATGHLHRVEILPSRTYDQKLPLIDQTNEDIREIDDKTPNLPTVGKKEPEGWIPHTWVQTLDPGALTSESVRPVDDGWPGTDLVIKVNGVRIAARGGNWGMDDMMKRVSTAHLEPFFRLHRDAHVNIIRNWMGQNTEESFYALADKYGLMVWNDFWESTENYNLEAEDPALFLKNARDTILHFRHHPSIVVWCGRNEGVPQTPINQGLAQLLRTLDHTRYYTPGSNQVNLRGSGPYLWEPPNTYFRINRGFSVELGMPSVPTLESFESFLPAPDRWPISDDWAYHDWHQSEGGRVSFYMNAMNTEFGAPTSFEDFVRKAQMLDYAGHRAIFEGMAAHLWQPNSGRMIWMTQPAWPSTEWNFVSWDYDTQSSFYGTKKALEPVHAQLNLDDESVDLINLGKTGPGKTGLGKTGFAEACPYSVRVRVIGLEGRTLSDQTYKVQAAADDRTSVTKLDLDTLSAGHTVFVVLDVADASGTPVSNNFYWWAADQATLRELDALPQAAIKASATVSSATDERKATATLTNSGTVPAIMAKLTLEDAATGRRILPAYYSDNYISLLPGEQRTITVELPAGAEKAAFGLRGWNIKNQVIGTN
jgi:Exo-beta-D-glucosaminidase Ig-fold domain/Glycosyl hydrolases family 2/Concanavalin A-like lectin/glucanases superfamily/Glycosyl hydrolases family 2, sugar binding domain/Glycosyl hydrolases family 2, TIM barrel domain